MKFNYFVRSLILVMMLPLSACIQQKESAYYLTHPEDIQSIYDQCVKRDKQDAPPTPQCTAIFRAIPTVKQYLTELINSPVQYGLEIMAAQNNLASLENNYHFAVNHSKDYQFVDKLAAQIEEQKSLIEARYALIRMLRASDG